MINAFAEGSTKKFCFIVGSSRSGTTYLNRILSHHPDVVGGSETHLIPIMSPMLHYYDRHKDLGHAQIGLHDWLSREDYMREIRSFFQRVTFDQKDPQHTGAVYLEKTPGNGRYLPLIDSLFEDVLVIHLMRDPIEVVDSLLRASKGWGKEWAPKSPIEATKNWMKAVGRACREGRPMGERYFECTYTKLTQDTENLVRYLLERLELTADRELIRSCIRAADDASDLPEGFVSGGQKQPHLGALGKYYVRRKTKPIIESYNLSFDS